MVFLNTDNIRPRSETDYLGDDQSPIFDVENVRPGDYIETPEEIESYLRSAQREYTQLVVYHTSTDYTQNFDRDQLVTWYRNEYDISDVNYHFLLLRDGRIQINKSIEEQTEHTPVANHNPFSISLAFMGGLNNGKQDIDSSAGAQWRTFRKFMACFYSVLPGGQVFGHSDINPNAVDPGFDVVRYANKAFGKRNTLLNSTARERGALGVSDLIRASRDRGFK